MTNMNTMMAATYGDIQVIIYITAIGGGLCMLWMLYLVFLRSDASQGEYMQFWGATLLVLIVTVIMMALLVHSMKTKYNTTRAGLTTLANCITNPTWKKVPTAMFNQSSMDSEHNWAITWLTMGLILIGAMGWVMMTVSQQLEDLNNQRRDVY